MPRLVDLTVALSSYDHTLDLTKGEVGIAGTRPDFVRPSASTGAQRRWDVSEIPLVAYAMLRAAGDDSLAAIPVFTQRLFPHRAVYVRTDRVREPGDLRGARVGVTAWADTTAVWARGMLSDTYGLGAGDMEWWQGTVGSEPAVLTDGAGAPAGVSLHQAGDRSLEEMLGAGELDAVIARNVSPRLRTPGDGDASVRPLYDDPASAERDYYAATGCLPPLRTVAIRREVLDQCPWIASNLYRAFEVSKRRYFVRLTEISASRTAIPWTSAYMTETQELFGEDPWPYGVEANRASVEVFLRYGVEQGLFAKQLSAEQLFAPVEPFVDGLN